MQVELDNDGERKQVTVNEAGTVYLGQHLAGKEITLAYEVSEE